MMRVYRILITSTLALGLIFTAACAKKAVMGDTQGKPAAEQTYAAGLGERTRFTTADMAKSYSTKAPADQIYYFNFDSSTVERKYLASIRAQARYLAANPSAKILLAGHTDAAGSREYNVALGERRAKSVANLLRLNGADNSQIRVVSYGEQRQIDRVQSVSDADYSLLNRRVVVTYEAVK